MTRMLCAALLLVLAGASVAHAQGAEAPPAAMPAPTESGPPPAASPEAGTRPVVSAGELAEEAPKQRPADLSYGVAARLRWVSVPAWMLNLFTKKNVPLSSWGTGVSFFRRKSNFDMVVSVN